MKECDYPLAFSSAICQKFVLLPKNMKNRSKPYAMLSYTNTWN